MSTSYLRPESIIMTETTASDVITPAALHDTPWEALVYQIIGHSELSTIRLPGQSRQSSDLAHVDRLFEQLQRILESVYSILVAKRNANLIIASISVLKIIGYCCDVASNSGSSPGNRTTRQCCVLDLLASAVRIAEYSDPAWSSEELLWVRDQIMDMVHEWKRQVPLSTVEEFKYQSVIAQCLHHRSQPGLMHAPTSIPSVSPLANQPDASSLESPPTKIPRSLPTLTIPLASDPSPYVRNPLVRKDPLAAKPPPSRKPVPATEVSISTHTAVTPRTGRSSDLSTSTTYDEGLNDSNSLSVELPAHDPVNGTLFRTSPYTDHSTGLEVVSPFTPQDPGQQKMFYESYPEAVLDHNTIPVAIEEKVFVAVDTQSIKTSSSSGSVSIKARKRWKSLIPGTKETPTVALPPSIEFCFSSCARHLWIWSKKDQTSVVRMRHPFTNAEHFSIKAPEGLAFPPNKAPLMSMRHLAATRDVVVAAVSIEDSRWLYILHENVFWPLLPIPKSIPAILAFALSPDGTHVAVGCGNFTLMYRIIGGGLSHPTRLNSMAGMETQAVRIQRLNFSVDSKRFVSAIQVEQGTQKHAAYISTWTCVETNFNLEARLPRVDLTVGYSNDSGMTAISLIGSKGVFLTAALSKPYPSILSTVPESRKPHIEITDTQFESEAQCLLSSRVCAVQSGRNHVFLVDGEIGTSQKVADFSSERRGLHLRNHSMVIAVPHSEKVLAVWRTTDEKIMLYTSLLGKTGKWSTSPLDLGDVYRQAAGISQ
ncbi:hypothetical protein K504DRAFT_539343 [Pleomassaria siparia CBS 279.74]|uniref:Uncharacterized protein n=1 Tax=Pleomassaria siparia CBS 279.74 TaxID=1314801 RepID=A0A6G1JQ79_9PLEO|nr:hypothetical protein K504DRAFT_539343 [Pleomassaria siparia CBS 279.74]